MKFNNKTSIAEKQLIYLSDFFGQTKITVHLFVYFGPNECLGYVWKLIEYNWVSYIFLEVQTQKWKTLSEED